MGSALLPVLRKIRASLPVTLLHSSCSGGSPGRTARPPTHPSFLSSTTVPGRTGLSCWGSPTLVPPGTVLVSDLLTDVTACGQQ